MSRGTIGYGDQSVPRETMPQAIPKACGCVGTAKCQRHKKPLYDRLRGTATARGYDSRWRKYAAWFKRQIRCEECGRNHSLCEECAKAGAVVLAYAVDHIIPHRGDHELFWRHSNHQSLCQVCHNRKSQTERLA